MLEQLKADVDRLRSEHTFAHELCRKELADQEGTVENLFWLFGLAEDLFQQLRATEHQLAWMMEQDR